MAAQCSDSVFARCFDHFNFCFFCFFLDLKKQGFLDSEQSSLANELLVAFDECDDARLAQTLKDSTFNLLDAPVRIPFSVFAGVGGVCLYGD